MGYLPKLRITPSRPFIHTGIDYAGPLQIRATTGRGRVQMSKGYIVLFICFSTKAIHLELVSSMTSQAFIAVLKRFISRRGIPTQMHCDNGTNFVGAQREISESFQEFEKILHDKRVFDFIAEHCIDFQFIPPSSPHFGGLWESNIKSVKTHLRRVTNCAVLSYEELYTLLVQIEGLLNSRPLTPMSDDVNDLNYLSPAHFLIGAPIVALPEGNYVEIKESLLTRWQNIQKRSQGFWNIWSKEYLTSLQYRPKWQSEETNLKIGNLVLIRDTNLPPSHWATGRITSLSPGKDGLVRVVTLKTSTGELKRPIVKLVKLPIE